MRQAWKVAGIIAALFTGQVDARPSQCTKNADCKSGETCYISDVAKSCDVSGYCVGTPPKMVVHTIHMKDEFCDGATPTPTYFAYLDGSFLGQDAGFQAAALYRQKASLPQTEQFTSLAGVHYSVLSQEQIHADLRYRLLASQCERAVLGEPTSVLQYIGDRVSPGGSKMKRYMAKRDDYIDEIIAGPTVRYWFESYRGESDWNAEWEKNEQFNAGNNQQICRLTLKAPKKRGDSKYWISPVDSSWLDDNSYNAVNLRMRVAGSRNPLDQVSAKMRLESICVSTIHEATTEQAMKKYGCDVRQQPVGIPVKTPTGNAQLCSGTPMPLVVLKQEVIGRTFQVKLHNQNDCAVKARLVWTRIAPRESPDSSNPTPPGPRIIDKESFVRINGNVIYGDYAHSIDGHSWQFKWSWVD